MPVFLLTDERVFPPPELAREDGLLAVGGDLDPARILLAYRKGIFPWFSPGEPILWWCPSPRFVLFPNEFRVPARLARTLRKSPFQITVDSAFRRVMEGCAAGRRKQNGQTWIDGRMIEAYCALYRMGHAHSIECWRDGNLAGGLYGVAMGSVFFGESMFSRERDSSKAALVYLVEMLRRWKFEIIDCQVHTTHLERFGARMMEGPLFQEILARGVRLPTQWRESLPQPVTSA